MRKSVSESASADANKKIFAKIDDGAVAYSSSLTVTRVAENWEVQRSIKEWSAVELKDPDEGNRIAQNRKAACWFDLCDRAEKVLH